MALQAAAVSALTVFALTRHTEAVELLSLELVPAVRTTKKVLGWRLPAVAAARWAEVEDLICSRRDVVPLQAVLPDVARQIR